MSASYPSGAKTFTTRTNGQSIDASHIDDLQDEVHAIEVDLVAGLGVARGGTGLSGVTSGGLLYGASGSAIASSALLTNHAPIIGAGAGAAPKTVAAMTNGQVLVGSTGADPVPAALTAGTGISVTPGAGTIAIANTLPSQITLLKANSGTDTSAGATTVDSIAISGLTAKDTILVMYSLESATANTANVILYDVTDSASIVSITGGAAISTGQTFGHAQLQQRQGSSTTVAAMAEGLDSGAARKDAVAFATLSAGWTSSWTLGLRHGGVTASGTFKYVWAVYKVAGQ